VLYPTELRAQRWLILADHGGAAIPANATPSTRQCRYNARMQGIIIRTLITMLGLFLAREIIPGVELHGTGSFILAALLLGLVNSLVRPVAFLMTFPLTIITLGLFIFVLNAAMFGLVAAFLDNFTVSGFWAAVFGAIIVSITSTIASWYIGPQGRYEVFVVRRR
jgi:putative membrane protein